MAINAPLPETVVAVPRITGTARWVGAGLARLRFLVAFLFVAQAADLWTTYAVLSLGGREASPVATFLLASGGFAALAAVKLAVTAMSVTAGLALVHRGSGRRARLILTVICAVYATAISWNLLNLVRLSAA